MDGHEAYELQYKRKINSIIETNLDKTYLKGFYNYLKSNKTSYSTIYDYLNYILRFMNHNKKDVETLCFDDYTDFLSQFSDMTSSYQISIYSGLKKFSEYLFASKKTNDNPMIYIKRPHFVEKVDTIKKRENGYLTTQEIKQYLSAADQGVGSSRAISRQKKWKERDILILKIFLTTGMRCSALYKLNIDSINLQKRTLITVDKGGNPQIHDISEELVGLIQEWLLIRNDILENENEAALFISNQKKRMNQSSIYRIVNKYAKTIRNKNITPHKLRATYGTQLLKETNDIYFVQECMGHSNPKTTELYIRGQKKDNRKRAANIMSSLIKY